MTKKVSRNEIGIIIPVRFEEGVICDTLLKIERTVVISHKIYVVDDHISDSDTTMSRVEKFAKTHSNIIPVYNNNHASGFTEALKRGVNASTEQYLVFVMADLCDEIELIERMHLVIKKGYDVVAGSRYSSGGSKSGGPVLQGFFSTIINFFVSYILSSTIHDVTNSFKMFRKATLSKIINSVRSPGVEVSMEIFLELYKLNARMTEIPTHWKGRVVGDSKFHILERFSKYGRLIFRAIQLALEKQFTS